MNGAEPAKLNADYSRLLLCGTPIGERSSHTLIREIRDEKRRNTNNAKEQVGVENRLSGMHVGCQGRQHSRAVHYPEALLATNGFPFVGGRKDRQVKGLLAAVPPGKLGHLIG